MSTKDTDAFDARLVIYTAIFGPEDHLQEPLVRPANVRFVCLTDQPFRSRNWEVKRIAPPVEGDMQRSNRFCKLFPYKFFPKHEYSVYIDGNMVVRGDPEQFIKAQLVNTNIAFFDHNNIHGSQIDCIYDEAELIYELAKKGTRKDDPDLVRRQMEFYRKEGYPAHNGLISGMTIARRHHAPDVIEAMEAWWNMLNTWSRRDQLSFNYIAWKLGLRVTYMPGDSTDNPFFLRVGHRLPLGRQLRLYLLAIPRRIMKQIRG